MPDSPLAGVRVLDLSTLVAGPYSTKLLAGMGAEVIKIESPGSGDPSRALGPFPEDLPDPEKSGRFLYLNTAKKSVTLDLEPAAGQGLLRRLVEGAQVVVESFPPGWLASQGLSYADLAVLNPALVVTSVTPFGQDGPYRDYAADDITAFAMGGLMDQSGLPELPPLKFGGDIVQYSAGLAAFSATLIALFYAELSGRGQHVDVSFMETIASHHFQSMVEYVYTGNERKRSRTMMIFPCADGYVNATAQAHQWPRVPEALGMPELLEIPEFQSVEGRRQNADILEAMILPWMVERTKEEIYHIGQQHHLPWGYLASVADLVHSLQYQERGFFQELDHPAAGKHLYPGTPLRLGETAWRHERAPLLGEHNRDVLGSLGLSDEDLVRLRQGGIV